VDALQWLKSSITAGLLLSIMMTMKAGKSALKKTDERSQNEECPCFPTPKAKSNEVMK
jgi:hypothetical protein